MKLFHGTTYNRYLKMLEAGFIGADCYEQVWNVSESETTYFWTEEYIMKENSFDGIDGNLEDLVMGAGKRIAAESAEIALAQERTNLRRVVLMFESEDLVSSNLSSDDSCENMDRCMQHTGLISMDKVKKVWIDSEPLDLFAMFFIGMALSRNEDNGYIKVEMEDQKDISFYGVQEGAKKLYEAMALDWIEDVSYNFELEEYYHDKTGTLINSYSHNQLIQNA